MTLREGIHVYSAEDDRVRADHELTIFGATFLRLHYRLSPKRVDDVSYPSERAAPFQD